jgi:mannan polymerase II complex MNN10 subunit
MTRITIRARTMAALSGLCPQRRVSKGLDSEQFILLGDSHARADTRNEGWLDHLESFKGTDVRHNLWSSSKSFFRALIIVIFGLLVAVGLLLQASEVLLQRANHLGRRCSDTGVGSHIPTKYKFAMISCSDGSKSIPFRSFEGIMDLVVPNKRSYVERHGYTFIDASDMLDKNRPPSWSKILAVKKHLSEYDYIFWNDADSVVTNPSTTLESIIYSITGNLDWDHMPDLILTSDVTGVNAGMFFLRNSEWSRQFLDLWWNQTSFVEPFGKCKSGDNDALKYLIKSMPEGEKRQHVLIPKMQCAFNSNLWRPNLRNAIRLVTFSKEIWRGVYAKGDFMVHLAGLNDKKKWVLSVLKDIKDDGVTGRNTAEKVDQSSDRKFGPSHRH